jgi:hypothetical protein
LIDHQQSQVGLRAESCARVLLLDSEILAAGQPHRGTVQAASSALWIANCTVTGEDTTTTGFSSAGGHGVELDASELLVWRSSIRGGDADSAKPTVNSTEAGGMGIAAAASSITVFGGPGSEIAGGDGIVELFGAPTPGGAAARLAAGSSLVLQAAVPISGGFNGSGNVQTQALVVDGTSSSTTTAQVFASLALAPAQVSIGGALALELAGNPGGLQFVFAAGATGPDLALPGIAGLGCLDLATLALVAVVPVGAAGSSSVPFVVPMDASLIGAAPFLQSAEGFGAQVSISNPVRVAIIG